MRTFWEEGEKVTKIKKPTNLKALKKASKEIQSTWRI